MFFSGVEKVDPMCRNISMRDPPTSDVYSYSLGETHFCTFLPMNLFWRHWVENVTNMLPKWVPNPCQNGLKSNSKT